MISAEGVSNTTDCFHVPMVFFRIGWMKHYDGVTTSDQIIGGGGYVEKNKTGGEVFNYRVHEGKNFGYVMPGESNGRLHRIGIERIDSTAKGQPFVTGVLVVWIARRPKGELSVVGWYSNATVYREVQSAPKGAHRKSGGELFGFNVEVDSSDSTLLPVDARTVTIPALEGVMHFLRWGFC